MPSLRTRPVLLLLALLAPLPAAAGGPASLVQDIAQTPPAVGTEAPPEQLRTVAAGVVFLTPPDASDPAARLWVADGTVGGTRALLAFCERQVCAQPPVMVASLPGLAFFLAESYGDPPSSPRLWRTDGTVDGTFPLTQPLAYYGLDSAVFAGHRLVFTACPTQVSCTLWSTDGSLAGTVEAPPISPGNLVTMGGRIWFLGYDRDVLGLWSTDGTDAGTWLIKRMDPGFLWLLTASGSRLFFMTGDESGELWTSDGTPGGTVHLKDFSESGHDFLPRVTNYLVPDGKGAVVFSGVRESNQIDLWRSDGTRQGTRPLTRFPNASLGSYFGRSLGEDQIAIAGGRILFLADDGISGPRLWSSRGWLTSTAPVTGCPEGCPALLPDSSLVALGKDRVLFAGRDLAHGTEVWRSDGTGAGTRLVADLCPGTCDSHPEAFVSLAGAVWLRATVGVPRLVRTDGTPVGTAVLAPLVGRANVDNGLPQPLDLAALGSPAGSRVIFPGIDPVDPAKGVQPWVTDGTPAGTRSLGGLPAPRGSAEPQDLAMLGDRLVFTASDGTARGVWAAEPVGASPLPLPAAGPGGASQVTAAGGLAYFTLDTLEGGDGAGDDLWRTDGTSAGTFRLATFPGRRLSAIHDFGGRLLFLASALPGAPSSFAFWTSDGTAAGTAPAFRPPDDTLQVVSVAVLAGGIYFAALREQTPQLFKSDGTAAGTHALLDFDCPCSSDLFHYTVLDGTVYFELVPGAVYRTDGTAAGTVAVYPPPDGSNRFTAAQFPQAFAGGLVFLGPQLHSSDGRQLVWHGLANGQVLRLTTNGMSAYTATIDPEFTAVGGTLFFRAWDPGHGVELWKTDGTPQGTALVLDAVPGPDSSDPMELTAAGSRLYFSARDGLHGRELWTSDGTAAGTHRVEDLAPGPSSSSPQRLTVLGDHLFFTADDGVTGRELWSLPLP
jgi:ELWxxDGT repeat protein